MLRGSFRALYLCTSKATECEVSRTVVLHLLAPTTPTVLLLDEPEAFLHPSQARLLGQIIAQERTSGTQLFVATHSTDILQGLVNVASDHLRVLRIQRDHNVNRIRELDKSLVKEISVDPLMRYSSVMAGVFHERVIICEAEADCMFYSSLLDLTEVHGERQPDVLFVHPNGKDRMPTLAKALVALDVPVDIIADIDILRGETTLKAVVNALGGDWSNIEPVAKHVRNEIQNIRPSLTSGEVKAAISTVLDSVPSETEFPREKHSEIEGCVSQSISLGCY